MDVKLTKDSEVLLCSAYKLYLERRRSGENKDNAKKLGDSRLIRELLLPAWSLNDVDETCRELHRANMLDCFYADNSVYSSLLTDNAIVYMENRFTDGLKGVLSFLAQFIP